MSVHRGTTLASVAVGSLGGYGTAMAWLFVVSARLPDPSAGAMTGDTPVSGWAQSALAILCGAGFAPFVALVFVFPVAQRMWSDRSPTFIDVIGGMALVGLVMFAVAILTILGIGGDQELTRSSAFEMVSACEVFAVVTGLLSAEIRRRILGWGKKGP